MELFSADDELFKGNSSLWMSDNDYVSLVINSSSIYYIAEGPSLDCHVRAICPLYIPEEHIGWSLAILQHV
jgi:hypothetical protein